MKKQTTFASDLGWRPGYWPTTVEFQSVTFQFVRHNVDGEGDVRSAIYRTSPSIDRELIVYND